MLGRACVAIDELTTRRHLPAVSQLYVTWSADYNQVDVDDKSCLTLSLYVR